MAGFTLIELLVVVAVLSTAAYLVLDTVDTDTNALRRQATENRLLAIRRAIVGRTDLTLNGAPAVSGYVADVGRLPECIEALLVRRPDCDDDGNPDADIAIYGDDADAVNGSANDGLIANRIEFGWRGPYLVAGPNGFVDAFGNTDVAPDFGWDVERDTQPVGTDDDGISFRVSSRGRDRASGVDAADSAGWGADYAMAEITADDFTLSLQNVPITLQVTNATATAQDVCIGLVVVDTLDDATGWKIEVIDADPADDDPFASVAAATMNAAGDDVPTTETVTATIGSLSTRIGRQHLVFYKAHGAGVEPTCAVDATDDTALDMNWLGSYPFLVAARMSIVSLEPTTLFIP